SLIDQGSSPQFVEWQRRVHPAGVIEVTIDQTVEEMPDVEPADPAGSVCVAHDVDRAAVSQQMIPLRPFGEFVDAVQIHQQKPPRINVRGIEAIEVYGFVAIVGAYSHEITLVTHHVDQLELLEQEAMGAKPSPTSGRVSMEILSGRALSKMKLKNVCPTSPSLQ